MSTLTKYVFGITMLVFLSACAPTVTPTGVDVSAISTQAAATFMLQMTQTVASRPTQTLTPVPSPTVTLTPTPTLTLTPGPTPLPPFPLDGYVMLFTKGSDLYFQDGNKSPVKLTHVGEERSSLQLSDDNKKVIFQRSSSIYSINTDGTQENPIKQSGAFNLWGTKLGGVEFVPGTHQLIFRTDFCNSTACVSSIYLMDSDTGENKKLADLGFSGTNQHGTFKISPNGKMVAIATTNFVDIIGMEGEVIRHDVLPFKPNSPYVLFPLMFWLPDSSGLIVGLPTTLFDSIAYDYVPAYTIWHYKINSNIAVQIPLDPPPMAFSDMGGGVQVSPDGQWIVYGGLGYNPEIYLGNLTNGHMQIVGKSQQSHYSWAPDSKHFIVTSAGSALSSIGAPALSPAGNFLEWIDSDHFALLINQGKVTKIGIAEIAAGALKIYGLGFDDDVNLLLIRPK